jgi:Na+-transporting NADH:ubiquinone oxidoreductase subunit NqrD
VRTQIWIAVAVDVLVASLKKRFALGHRLPSQRRSLCVGLATGNCRASPRGEQVSGVSKPSSAFFDPNKGDLCFRAASQQQHSDVGVNAIWLQ